MRRTSTTTAEKRALRAACCTLGLLAAAAATTPARAAQTRTGDTGPGRAVHSLMVNGRPVNNDVAPQVLGGTVMVPIRFVAEYLGGEVEWKPATRVVRITRGGGQSLVMIVGSTRAAQNNEGRALAAAPVIVRGRTLIPLREVARFFDAQVQYNGQAGTVFISAPQQRSGRRTSGGGGGASEEAGQGSGSSASGLQ